MRQQLAQVKLGHRSAELALQKLVRLHGKKPNDGRGEEGSNMRREPIHVLSRCPFLLSAHQVTMLMMHTCWAMSLPSMIKSTLIHRQTMLIKTTSLQTSLHKHPRWEATCDDTAPVHTCVDSFTVLQAYCFDGDDDANDVLRGSCTVTTSFSLPSASPPVPPHPKQQRSDTRPKEERRRDGPSSKHTAGSGRREVVQKTKRTKGSGLGEDTGKASGERAVRPSIRAEKKVPLF